MDRKLRLSDSRHAPLFLRCLATGQFRLPPMQPCHITLIIRYLDSHRGAEYPIATETSGPARIPKLGIYPDLASRESFRVYPTGSNPMLEIRPILFFDSIARLSETLTAPAARQWQLTPTHKLADCTRS